MEPKKWLRCNYCYSLMCKSKDPFSLTFCGHIFCSKCVQEATKQCPQCKSDNVPAMALTEPLKPEIKHLFESTDELLEKLRQATLFKNVQYSLNSKRYEKLEDKYALYKVGYNRKSKELHQLLEKEKNLQKQLQELRYQQESKLKLVDYHEPSSMMTPISNVSSLRGSDQYLRSLDSMRNNGHSSARPKPSHKSMMTPAKLQGIDLNSEFRIPNSTKVPRSVGSYSKTFSNSSRGIPFSNYTPFSNRR